jgi:DNA polymerase-3 subunit beta
MTSTSGKYNLVGQIGEEYPSLPEMSDDKNSLTVPVDVLCNGINKTLFAAATDELRPTMTGVFFDIRQDSLTCVATDAHKLVRFKTTAVQPNLVANFILPQKPSGVLKNILPKESGDVTIEFDGKNVAFTLSRYKMFCRQIEGRFPNYENVIPKQEDNINKIVVDRASLVNALRRVSLFTNQANNLIKLALSNDSLNISAQDIDFSISAEETLDCQYSGQLLTIGFKSQFLIEILNNINSSEVLIELSDPSRAGLILPYEQNEDEHLLMLLMPMLLND